MTREELDTLWGQALHESVVADEDFIRYHFAALVAKAEREACAALFDDHNIWDEEAAAIILARGKV